MVSHPVFAFALTGLKTTVQSWDDFAEPSLECRGALFMAGNVHADIKVPTHATVCCWCGARCYSVTRRKLFQPEGYKGVAGGGQKEEGSWEGGGRHRCPFHWTQRSTPQHQSSTSWPLTPTLQLLQDQHNEPYIKRAHLISLNTDIWALEKRAGLILQHPVCVKEGGSCLQTHLPEENWIAN